MDYPGQDLLLTLAEISIAYVGFSAIVGALSSSSKEWNSEIKLFLRSMIEVGLFSMSLSLLPEFFLVIGLEEQYIWMSASGVGLVIGGAMFANRMRQLRTAIGRPLPVGRFVLIPLGLIAMVIMILNVVIWQTPGPYVVATMLSLTSATVMFLALVYQLFPLNLDKES